MRNFPAWLLQLPESWETFDLNESAFLWYKEDSATSQYMNDQLEYISKNHQLWLE